jgi:hypothetical protein
MTSPKKDWKKDWERVEREFLSPRKTPAEKITDGLLSGAATTPPQYRPHTGQCVLLYGRGMKVLGFLCLAIVFFLIIMALTVAPVDWTDGVTVACAMILGGGFLIAGVLILIETFKARILISETEIIGQAPWPGYPKRILWQDVSKVSVNLIMEWFVVRSKDGNRMAVSKYLKGIMYFCDFLLQRPEIEITRTARKVIDEIRGHTTDTYVTK